MPIVRQYKCDGCGAEKKEANRWWVLRITHLEITLMTLERAESVGIQDTDLIMCGQGCVTKKISEWMGSKIRATDSQADGEK